jgi:uncharacterized membrane protein
VKALFKRGLLALLPAILTIAVVYFVVTSLYHYIAMPIGDALMWLISHYTENDAAYYAKSPGSDSWFGWVFRWAPYIGLIVGFVLVFMIGAIVATFFGKKIGKGFESLLLRVPVINAVYPYAKQFTDFFSPSDGRPQFKNAVALPFPAPGIWSVGFITSEGLRHLDDHLKQRLVCIFVPTAPTPFTGYVVYVPRAEVIPLPITVDEALALIISCGVVTPAHQAISLLHFSEKAAEQGTVVPPPPGG